MKKTLLLALTCLLVNNSFGQTWAVDVAPILYSNCTKCHNPNGIAPFPLITYMDAYSHSQAVRSAVVNHIMPPWPPDPNYRRLAHERLLTTAQIQTIDDWVNAGSPSGNISLAPTPPVYTGQAEITSPDLVAKIPNYTVTSTSDIYRCFVIPSGLATQKYITQIEGLPGNRGIVHHVLVYEDTSSIPASNDASDPGPGYTNFGGTGSSYSNLIGAWVPGSMVYKLPAGMGILLHANTNIIIQVHYPAGSFGQSDSTKINFKLSDGPLRPVSISPVLNHITNINSALNIPPDSVRVYTEQYRVFANYSLLSVGPHMHLIGRSISSWGEPLTGGTIPFVSIPNWNFHWQGSYGFRTVLKIPAGTLLRATATYDNTLNNPWNPNNPPQTVQAGESTTDEMMLIYFAYTPYQTGDENIVIDSTVLTEVPAYTKGEPFFLDAFPNPSQSQVKVQFYLQSTEGAELSIYDLNGRLVSPVEHKHYDIGVNTLNLDISYLPEGIYFLRLQTASGVCVKKLLKT